MWIVRSRYVRSGVQEYYLTTTDGSAEIHTYECYEWAKRMADTLNRLEAENDSDNRCFSNRKKHIEVNE